MDSVTPETPSTPVPYPNYARVLLSLSVFLTCLGYLYRFSHDNLRAFSQIYFEWGFAERTAEIIVDIMQGTLWLALAAAPFRRLRVLTLPAFCALLFELLCLCLNSNAYYPWLSIPAQALRLAPFIIILMPWKRQAIIWILKIAAAVTFIGHGIEAVLTYPEFVDYLLAFFQKIHLPVKEFTASTLLHIIGTIDIFLGHHVVVYSSQRTKWIMRYMIFWGAVTAFVRIMYYGPGAWHEVAIRNSHFLIVYLLMVIVSSDSTEDAPEASL